MSEKIEKKTQENTKPKLSEQEFEKKVIELAEKGLTAEKIGEVLRKENIHPKKFSKKISRILKEKGKYTSPDLKNIKDKLERIKKHYGKNKQDKRALRDKDRIFAKLRRTEKNLGR